jgi:hypothetical protein
MHVHTILASQIWWHLSSQFEASQTGLGGHLAQGAALQALRHHRGHPAPVAFSDMADLDDVRLWLETAPRWSKLKEDVHMTYAFTFFNEMVKVDLGTRDVSPMMNSEWAENIHSLDRKTRSLTMHDKVQAALPMQLADEHMAGLVKLMLKCVVGMVAKKVSDTVIEVVDDAFAPAMAQIITVSDGKMLDFELAVQGLKASKRDKYKTYVEDTRGCRHRVMYSTDVIPVATGFGSHWYEFADARQAAVRKLPQGTKIPIMSCTQKADMIEAIQRTRLPLDIEHDLASGSYGAMPSASDHVDHVLTRQAETHTGKHKPHQPKISVPTKAGEPVRG